MDIFTALAVPTRRNIIEMLAKKGRLSATDIYEQFKISPPAISQHLKVLKQVKLVQVEKHGQLRIYEINLKEIQKFEEWSKKMTDLWSKRFDALDTVLATDK